MRVRQATNNPFRNTPGHLVRRVHQAAVAIFAEEFEELGLTPVQYATLLAARGTPGVDATGLSEAIALDRSTLGAVLDRLEAKGLVRRTTSAQDRRAKVVTVSAKGKLLLAKANPLAEQVQKRLVERLTKDEVAKLIELLGKVAGVEPEGA